MKMERIKQLYKKEKELDDESSKVRHERYKMYEIYVGKCFKTKYKDNKDVSKYCKILYCNTITGTLCALVLDRDNVNINTWFYVDEENDVEITPEEFDTIKRRFDKYNNLKNGHYPHMEW